MNLIQLNNIILNIIYIYTEKYLNIKINSNKILYSIKSCINELSEKDHFNYIELSTFFGINDNYNKKYGNYVYPKYN